MLRGLRDEDVRRVIQLAAGIVPPSDLVQTVYAHTEGNPLFVAEVVRLLVQEGELRSDNLERRESWSVRIPEGVREVIGKRLDRLSASSNEALTVAAVIGRQFSARQIAPVLAEVSEERLYELLEEACEARIIEEVPRAASEFQFTHALIHETLLADLSVTRRVRLHAEIAQQLERMYGDRAEEHAAELAHHFANAEAVLGTERLVRYSRMAGEQALATHAHEEALSQFERGLSGKADQPPDAETAELLFGLARARDGVGGPAGQGKEPLLRAFEYFRQAGETERAVEVASYPLFAGWAEWVEGMPEMAQSALALVEPESTAAGRLLCQYGAQLFSQKRDPSSSRTALETSLAIA